MSSKADMKLFIEQPIVHEDNSRSFILILFFGFPFLFLEFFYGNDHF